MSTRPAFHPWTKSTTCPDEYSRSLATQEFMLSMLNEYALGHNSPYLGVTVSIEHPDNDHNPLILQDLQARVTQAFIHARQTMPVVACQIRHSKQMVYKVEEAIDVAKWAARTVRAVESRGGWLDLHDKLSREVILPSEDGDCAFLYLIVKPEEAEKSQVTEFDLLLHMHHGLADGAGLRSIMNEVLVGLHLPRQDKSHSWGQEVEKLNPAALDVAIISEEVVKSLTEMPKEIALPPLSKPLFDGRRPGTGVVTHTLQGVSFLDDLLTLTRANNVTLTAVIQAALSLALYDSVKPTADEACTVLSGFDLRTRNLHEPWSQRNRFIGAAVGLELMAIPATALEEPSTGASSNERFWAVARRIYEAWLAVARRQDVAAANELRRAATGFIIKGVLADISTEKSNLSMSLNYVSDPAGSKQLDGVYGADPTEGKENTRFVLVRYQLVTDESTSKLSCRSHSWNDELTLCISYNTARHEEAEVRAILDKWTQTIEELKCSEAAARE
ncbi:hypothetical protein G7046_g1528 [Stylonectria norvegica]|nr:hypothetical protein G7046_g1528 [Stylonectria norvegica]